MAARPPRQRPTFLAVLLAICDPSQLTYSLALQVDPYVVACPEHVNDLPAPYGNKPAKSERAGVSLGCGLCQYDVDVPPLRALRQESLSRVRTSAAAI